MTFKRNKKTRKATTTTSSNNLVSQVFIILHSIYSNNIIIIINTVKRSREIADRLVHSLEIAELPIILWLKRCCCRVEAGKLVKIAREVKYYGDDNNNNNNSK